MVSAKEAFIISLLLTLAIFIFDFVSKSGFLVLERKSYSVLRVIDGDTVELSNGERIRLIGINAPELDDYFGKDAKEFLSKMVEGKNVYLEHDLRLKDDFERTLAFVFVDGRNVNVEMVRNGFAHTFEVNKISKYVKELKEAEAMAMERQVGIWKRSNISCIKLLDLKVYGEEKVVLKNNCNFSIQLENWSLKDESNNRFVFPNYLFKEGEIIEIYSTNMSSKFSFRKKFPIWNREGDTLFLRDSFGYLVLFYRY